VAKSEDRDEGPVWPDPALQPVGVHALRVAVMRKGHLLPGAHTIHRRLAETASGGCRWRLLPQAFVRGTTKRSSRSTRDARR
jgi:hypothetical protein